MAVRLGNTAIFSLHNVILKTSIKENMKVKNWFELVVCKNVKTIIGGYFFSVKHFYARRVKDGSNPLMSLMQGSKWRRQKSDSLGGG